MTETMRKRLDEFLVEQGLADTRARARGFILRGLVTVSGVVAGKAGQLVTPGVDVALSADAPAFVSFGADKLIKALDDFGAPFDPRGRICLDVGASTGGFTDVLLRRGAPRVYAVDVGRDQLHASLRADPRVHSIEGFDARSISRVEVPEPVDAVVADVSFISLTKVLGPVLDLTREGAWLIALIKPQFEAGPAAIGKGGIVRSPEARAAAVDLVRTWLSAQPGWQVRGLVTWPGLQGRTNEEYLIGASRDA